MAVSLQRLRAVRQPRCRRRGPLRPAAARRRTRRARRPAGPASRACWAWPADEALRYADDQGQRRTLRQPRGDELRLSGLLLAGDTRAEAWLRVLLQDDLPVAAYGQLLLRPGATPPAGGHARQAVCACWGVTDRPSKTRWPLRRQRGGAPGPIAGGAEMWHELWHVCRSSSAWSGWSGPPAPERRPESSNADFAPRLGI
jgi:assimilatory nitrate reductase catalytic subunit